MAADHPAAGAFSLPNHEPNAALMGAILREYRRDAKVPQEGGSPRHYGVPSVSGEADPVAAEIQEARAAEAANPGGGPWWALLWSKYHEQGIDLGVWEQSDLVAQHSKKLRTPSSPHATRCGWERVQSAFVNWVRKDANFMQYAHYNMWPHVKLYSFADGLKSLCMQFFGLSHEQVHGSEKDKNTPSKIMWEDIPTWENSSLNKNRGTMTARELLQYFANYTLQNIFILLHFGSS